MRRVVIESPYAGDIEKNLRYAKACVMDSLHRGEAPFASHLFFTQEGLLDDKNPEERDKGIRAGLEIVRDFDLSAVYTDLNISEGMKLGIKAAKNVGRLIEYRTLPNWEG